MSETAKIIQNSMSMFIYDNAVSIINILFALLLHRFHIPMSQAALGVDLEYETLDSREIISVQPGTQSGHIFRLKGKGVPHLNGRGRGDFVIEVVVDTPTDLTSEQENILRDYADKRNEEVNFKQKRTLRRR